MVRRRSRADSVLGNRMDEHVNFKKMKTNSSRWAKLRQTIDKKGTQLVLFEVPKGVST